MEERGGIKERGNKGRKCMKHRCWSGRWASCEQVCGEEWQEGQVSTLRAGIIKWMIRWAHWWKKQVWEVGGRRRYETTNWKKTEVHFCGGPVGFLATGKCPYCGFYPKLKGVSLVLWHVSSASSYWEGGELGSPGKPTHVQSVMDEKYSICGAKGEWQKGVNQRVTLNVILTADPSKWVSILRAWMSIVLNLISFLQVKRKLKIFMSTGTSFH